ncbi:hypothetical protein JWG45_05200 [Leptospira sp. 201903070]|uniref:DUF2442 domain-containing protein n=1 Tax=Leptospira ainlahdjerensis TaxID=2810033 RepID=A0ABS2U853_9LEPT|nr:hypothetical protein [Leptospira ainlahdjerensis]MBM9576547.1 hypothetical protein [Leptospira ainlahdjerensis]
MNRIEAVYNRSFYSAEEHLDIRIDGEILSSFLNRKLPEHQLSGLVPTLLDWLENEEERKIVRERILPSTGESVVAPILMCPDDCDFFCTLVVAEIERLGDFVFWKRLGLDDSEFEITDLSSIGSKVHWFSGLEERRFPIGDYVSFLNRFKPKS